MANLGLKMQEKILKRQFSDSLGGGISNPDEPERGPPFMGN